MGRRYSHPIRLGGLGERYELSQQGLGQRIVAYLKVEVQTFKCDLIGGTKSPV